MINMTKLFFLWCWTTLYESYTACNTYINTNKPPNIVCYDDEKLCTGNSSVCCKANVLQYLKLKVPGVIPQGDMSVPLISHKSLVPPK